MLAILGGTSLLASKIFSAWTDKKVKTPDGTVAVKKGDGAVFLQRHGTPPVPPHRIPHRANIGALKDLGATSILAINSVGSLKAAIKPGSLVIPDDFVSPWHVETFYDQEMCFMVPSMDRAFAERVFALCARHTKSVTMGGVYVQTIGPRLETKAEIRMLKRYGDIIGMTLASEATLALETSLPYASICSVDNFAHGITKVPLTMDQIAAKWAENAASIESIIAAYLKEGGA